MAINEEGAISLCRFYKGEEECPYDLSDIRSTYWDIEQTWVKIVLPNEDKEDNLLFAFLICCGGMDAIDIPGSLKATFFDHFYHWNGSKDGFLDFLLQYLSTPL